jgi:hypothetical protein
MDPDPDPDPDLVSDIWVRIQNISSPDPTGPDQQHYLKGISDFFKK